MKPRFDRVVVFLLYKHSWRSSVPVDRGWTSIHRRTA